MNVASGPHRAKVTSVQHGERRLPFEETVVRPEPLLLAPCEGVRQQYDQVAQLDECVRRRGIGHRGFDTVVRDHRCNFGLGRTDCHEELTDVIGIDERVELLPVPVLAAVS